LEEKRAGGVMSEDEEHRVASLCKLVAEQGARLVEVATNGHGRPVPSELTAMRRAATIAMQSVVLLETLIKK